jgi:hypothetical protein
MKSLLLFSSFFFAIGLNGQVNNISIGYGLNIADNEVFTTRGHYIVANNLVMKASYTRNIYEFIHGKIDVGYADYDVVNGFLSVQEPTFTEKTYKRISVSIGPVFKLLTVKRFTFLSGFNAGYHFGNDHTVILRPYFDYAINPLSITYTFKGFSVVVDSYIGSNMYSNVFIGLGYSF